MPVNEELLARADRFAKQGTATDLEVELAAALRAALAARPQLIPVEVDSTFDGRLNVWDTPWDGKTLLDPDTQLYRVAAVAGSATPTEPWCHDCDRPLNNLARHGHPERWGCEDCGAIHEYPTEAVAGSATPTGTGICPTCERPIIDHDNAERKQCHDAVSGYQRAGSATPTCDRPGCFDEPMVSVKGLEGELWECPRCAGMSEVAGSATPAGG